ncbi:MAG: T9SS type A sorting domain-containing protein [Rhodothermales bacterium]|nr:T9SS type A sorting domain-containing protein [Rhodothermales bacterium]
MTSVRSLRAASHSTVLTTLAIATLCLGIGTSALPTAAFGQATKIYWTDFGSTKVQRADTNGSNVENIVTNPAVQPFEIEVDVANAQLYWTETTAARIQRSNMDGTGIVDVVTGLDTPRGLALDETNGKIYWTDWGTLKIQRANLDGSSVEDLVTSGLSIPRGITLDPTSSKMYWTDSGTSKIQRADLDGSNVEDLITTGLSTPVGIDIDPVNGKMYWTDQDAATIHRSNLDGSGQETIVSSGLLDPSYISVDEVSEKLYWTDFGTAWIQSANLDGSSVTNVVTAGLIIPTGLALAPSAALPVELSRLQAYTDDDDILLSWTTTSERNASGFEVQIKEEDAWSASGFIPAIGSEGVETEYSFRISDRKPGRHGIRLRMIDLDGSFNYSATIEINVGVSGALLLSEPYPNPLRYSASFDVASDRAQHIDVSLFDLQGREVRRIYSGVLESDTSATLMVEAGGLSSGIYILRLRGEAAVVTKRIAVVR